MNYDVTLDCRSVSGGFFTDHVLYELGAITAASC